jgi:hypothetical protein
LQGWSGNPGGGMKAELKVLEAIEGERMSSLRLLLD